MAVLSEEQSATGQALPTPVIVSLDVQAPVEAPISTNVLAAKFPEKMLPEMVVIATPGAAEKGVGDLPATGATPVTLAAQSVKAQEIEAAPKEIAPVVSAPVQVAPNPVLAVSPLPSTTPQPGEVTRLVMAESASGPEAVSPQSEVEGSSADEIASYLPVFRRTKHEDGSTQFRLLDPFGALLRNSEFVDTKVAPLFAVWSVEKDADRNTTHRAVLWKLFEQTKTEDQSSYTLGFGIFKSNKLASGERKIRVLWIPVS